MGSGNGFGGLWGRVVERGNEGGGKDLISVLYVALIFYLFLSRTSVHHS